MRYIMVLLVTLLCVGACYAAPVEKAPLISPEFTIGIGQYQPTDFGYIRSWKGFDTKTYIWGQVGSKAYGGLNLNLRVEQVIQRLEGGARPTMVTRLEAGWTF